MKFEVLYPSASKTDRFAFLHSFVTKTPGLQTCNKCRALTRWIDVLFQVGVCSEECLTTMWESYQKDAEVNGTYKNFKHHFDNVKRELALSQKAQDAWKDVLIVNYNQLSYLKDCLTSLQEHTKNVHLHLWDNGSDQATQTYLSEIEQKISCLPDWKITVYRQKENQGFIIPNNTMAKTGTSPYVILLNSDTKVFQDWSNLLLSQLQNDSSIKQVGFWGGYLDKTGKGYGGSNGFEVDYISGWGFCIERSTYERYGLFSEDYTFAYFEDADFSLRLKKDGHKVYAAYAPLVHHYQNKTILEVEKEKTIDIVSTFKNNHQIFQTKWKEYLENDRINRDTEVVCS